MKFREIFKILKEDGWYQVREKGSHKQFKHPIKKGCVTVAGHPGIDINPETLSNILKQAGIKIQRRG